MPVQVLLLSASFYFYILDTSPLSVIHVTNIFLSSMACLFTLYDFFWQPKVLNFNLVDFINFCMIAAFWLFKKILPYLKLFYGRFMFCLWLLVLLFNPLKNLFCDWTHLLKAVFSSLLCSALNMWVSFQVLYSFHLLVHIFAWMPIFSYHIFIVSLDKR